MNLFSRNSYNLAGVQYLFVLLLFFGGCFSSEDNKITKKEISHPQAEYMPYFDKVNVVTYQDPIESESLRNFLISINNSEEKISIGGVQTGEQAQIFGTITGLVTNESNNIYILDNITPTLKKYNSDGEINSIYKGEKGKRESNLFRPTDIELADNNLIYLSDAYGNVKIIDSSGEMSFERALDSASFSSDMCIIEDELFLRVLGKNRTKLDSTIYNMVHVHNIIGGEYIRSTGLPYRSPRQNTNRMLSGRGKMACIESTDTIIYSFEYFPHIYGYSPDGEIKWVTELSPFNGYDVIEKLVNGDVEGYSFSSKGNKERIISIQSLFEEYFLVQVAKKGGFENNISSYILSSKTGEGVYRTNAWPNILHINDEYFYAKNINTYPGIKVYKY